MGDQYGGTSGYRCYGNTNQMTRHMKGENLVKLVLNTADKNINGYNVNIHGRYVRMMKQLITCGRWPTTGRAHGTVTSLTTHIFNRQ